MRAVFVVAGAVLLLAVLVASIHLSSNSLEFSRYNRAWNGTSSFFAGLDPHQVTEVRSPGQLAGYRNGAALLIIAPDRAPSRQETAAYLGFLSRGNTLVLVDDFGAGNRILEAVGSGIALLPGNLSSIDREYADPYSVVAYPAGRSRLLADGRPLLLNRPAAIEGGKALALTSIFSWIDENGDRKANSGEPFGQFAVLAEEENGGGTVLVLSDPSILVNAMDTPGTAWGNRMLIAEIANSTGPVLIDQMNTRTDDAEGLSAVLHVIRTTLSYELILLALLLPGGIYCGRRMLR